LSFSLIAYFIEKKRMSMKDRLEILERYGVKSAKELEEKIKRGDVKEHPAWEDLITVENLADIVVRGDILRLAFIRCAAKTQSLFSGQYIR
ncbi:MAG: hypothetical protein N2V75_09540, partial [Methanophagales archaeon]|nr:hypothetical protein [Methanophagales archaeon]